MAKRGAPKGNTNRRGKPSKRSEEIMQKLAALNCDPIEGMARIARDAEQAEYGTKREWIDGLSLAGAMYKELAQYVAPKLRAMEISVDNESQLKEAIVFTRLDANNNAD